jgi:hypothetical protein
MRAAPLTVAVDISSNFLPLPEAINAPDEVVTANLTEQKERRGKEQQSAQQTSYL